MSNLPRVDLQSVFIYLIPFLLFSFLVDRTQCAPAVEGDDVDGGCYYMFNHYGEGDRILTNEPCLNCTCHNSMLMCYLRVCPFTKPIGQECTIEKKPDQCCPVISCPEVPVSLVTPSALTSTTTATTSLASVTESSTDLANYERGCEIEGKYYPDGAQVAGDSTKPCELCYCIRNRTACVMQECILHVEGCQPVFQSGVCCPVRYQCDYPPQITDQSTVAGVITTTISSIFSSTPQPGGCLLDGEYYADGSQIPGAGPTPSPCEHCYCMRGDVVCAVQECGTPLENVGGNCTAISPPPGLCCPEKYTCESDKPLDDESATTLSPIDFESSSVSPVDKVEEQTVVPSADEPEVGTEEKVISQNVSEIGVSNDALSTTTTASTLEVLGVLNNQQGEDMIEKIDESSKNDTTPESHSFVSEKPASVSPADLEDEDNVLGSTTVKSPIETHQSTEKSQPDDDLVLLAQGLTLPPNNLTTEKTTEKLSEVTTDKPVDASSTGPPSTIAEVGEPDSDGITAVNDDNGFTSQSETTESMPPSKPTGDGSDTFTPGTSKDGELPNSSESPLESLTDKLLASSTENLLVISEGPTEKPNADQAEEDRFTDSNMSSTSEPSSSTDEKVIISSERPVEGATESLIPSSERPIEESTENIIPSSDEPVKGSTESALASSSSSSSSESPVEGSTDTLTPSSERPLEGSTENLIVSSDKPFEGSTESISIASTEKPVEDSTDIGLADDKVQDTTNEIPSVQPFESSTTQPLSSTSVSQGTSQPAESEPVQTLDSSTGQPIESQTAVHDESPTEQPEEASTVQPQELTSPQSSSVSSTTESQDSSATVQTQESSSVQPIESVTPSSEAPLTETQSPLGDQPSVGFDDETLYHPESTTSKASVGGVEQESDAGITTMKTIMSDAQEASELEKLDDGSEHPVEEPVIVSTPSANEKVSEDSSTISSIPEKDVIQTTVSPISDDSSDQAPVQQDQQAETGDAGDKMQPSEIPGTTPQPSNLDTQNEQKVQEEGTTVGSISGASEDSKTTPISILQDDKFESSSLTEGLEDKLPVKDDEVKTTQRPGQIEGTLVGDTETMPEDSLKDKLSTGQEQDVGEVISSTTLSSVGVTDDEQNNLSSSKPTEHDGVVIGESTVSSTPEPAESLSMHKTSTSSPDLMNVSSPHGVLPSGSETENEIGDDTDKISHDSAHVDSSPSSTTGIPLQQEESSTNLGESSVSTGLGQEETTKTSQTVPVESQDELIAMDKPVEDHKPPNEQGDEEVTTSKLPLESSVTEGTVLSDDKLSDSISTAKPSTDSETETGSEKSTEIPVKAQNDEESSSLSGIETTVRPISTGEFITTTEPIVKLSSELPEMQQETDLNKEKEAQDQMAGADNLEQQNTSTAITSEDVSTTISPVKSVENEPEDVQKLSDTPGDSGIPVQPIDELVTTESSIRPVTDKQDEGSEKTTLSSLKDENQNVDEVSESGSNDAPPAHDDQEIKEQSTTISSLSQDGGDATVSSVHTGDTDTQTVKTPSMLPADAEIAPTVTDGPVQQDETEVQTTTSASPLSGSESDSSSSKPGDTPAISQSTLSPSTDEVVGSTEKPEIASSDDQSPDLTATEKIEIQTPKDTQMLNEVKVSEQSTDASVMPIEATMKPVETIAPLLEDVDSSATTDKISGVTEVPVSDDVIESGADAPQDQDTKTTVPAMDLLDSGDVTTAKAVIADGSLTELPNAENIGQTTSTVGSESVKPETPEATTTKYADEQEQGLENVEKTADSPESSLSDMNISEKIDDKSITSTTSASVTEGVTAAGVTEIIPSVSQPSSDSEGEASVNDEPINLQGSTETPPAQVTESKDEDISVTKMVTEAPESASTVQPNEASLNDQSVSISSDGSTVHPQEESSTKIPEVSTEGAQVTEMSMDDTKVSDESSTNFTSETQAPIVAELSSSTLSSVDSSTSGSLSGDSTTPYPDVEEGERPTSKPIIMSHEMLADINATTQAPVIQPDSPTIVDMILPSEKFHDGASTDISLIDDDENANPMGVPGEGYCFVEGKTYPNGSNIPPTTPCHIVCACQNSIVHCLLVHCPPPPRNTGDCKPIYKSGVCCPEYDCGETGGSTVTVTPGSIDKEDSNFVTITPETPSLETTSETISRETLAPGSQSTASDSAVTTSSPLSSTESGEISGSSSQEKESNEDSEAQKPMHDASSESSSDSTDASHSSSLPTTVAPSLVNETSSSLYPEQFSTVNETTNQLVNATDEGLPLTTSSSESPALVSSSSLPPTTSVSSEEDLDASKVEALMNETLGDSLSSVAPGNFYPVTTTTTVTPSSASWPYPTPTPASVMSTGACLFDGRVYMSAQQIPRDDPCDFCFCFRGDIICLQQSCPPPIPGCYEEPIPGFCCPRYECPVGNGNVTTEPPLFPPSYYHNQILNGVASGQNPGAIAANMPSGPGCEIQGEYYESGQVITSTSGPCLECRCGATGMMECDPRECQPEPMLRKMIAAITSR